MHAIRYTPVFPRLLGPLAVISAAACTANVAPEAQVATSKFADNQIPPEIVGSYAVGAIFSGQPNEPQKMDESKNLVGYLDIFPNGDAALRVCKVQFHTHGPEYRTKHFASLVGAPLMPFAHSKADYSEFDRTLGFTEPFVFNFGLEPDPSPIGGYQPMDHDLDGVPGVRLDVDGLGTINVGFQLKLQVDRLRTTESDGAQDAMTMATGTTLTGIASVISGGKRSHEPQVPEAQEWLVGKEMRRAWRELSGELNTRPPLTKEKRQKAETAFIHTVSLFARMDAFGLLRSKNMVTHQAFKHERNAGDQYVDVARCAFLQAFTDYERRQ